MEEKEYLAAYQSFVDGVTSETAKNDELFAQNFTKLSKQLKGNYARLDHAVSGLCGEVGEVDDVWKKIKFMGLNYTNETRDMFIKELGDVCWYMFQACLALDVPFEEIINRNMEKLKKRHPNGYSPAYFHQKKGE